MDQPETIVYVTRSVTTAYLVPLRDQSKAIGMIKDIIEGKSPQLVVTPTDDTHMEVSYSAAHYIPPKPDYYAQYKEMRNRR